MSNPTAIYISGPISGMSDSNLPAFAAAARDLAAKHPKAKIRNPFDNGLSPDANWSEHMRADIKMMMECDAVALLPGWQKSKGACIENDLAEALGMDCMPIEAWLS